MPVPLCADAHIPRAVTVALRLAEVDILTAQEDGAITLPDPDLLDRAYALGRTLVTFDDDLLTEATRRQRQGIPFAGVVFATPIASRSALASASWRRSPRLVSLAI